MSNEITSIPLDKIVPGPNDRTVFGQAEIEELADAIRTAGLLNPITVRPLPNGLYELVAGERRSRALRHLGWSHAPCVVVEMDDRTASLAMLAENVSRQSLDPIDEARAYKRRMDAYDLTENEIADLAGVSVHTVRNRLALLGLRRELSDLVRTGDLQVGYAKILADAALNTDRQMIAFRRLRDNPNPTPRWFRLVCADLLAEQAQESLFGLPLLGGEPLPAPAPAAPDALPPHPSTDAPPVITGTPVAILDHQITFWEHAAAEWDRRGKVFKKQECQAAAAALRSARAAVAAASPSGRKRAADLSDLPLMAAA